MLQADGRDVPVDGFAKIMNHTQSEDLRHRNWERGFTNARKRNLQSFIVGNTDLIYRGNWVVDAEDPVQRWLCKGGWLCKSDKVKVSPTDTVENQKDTGKLVRLGTEERVFESIIEEGQNIRAHAPRREFRVVRAAVEVCR